MIDHHNHVMAKTLKVLVVEDEFLIRMTLSEALADEGFVVVEAETADGALPLLQSDEDISLLVTDIQMPGALDGYALVRAVRQDKPALPVIYMTGRPPADAGPASDLDVFIAKPYTLDEICTAAKRLLGAVSA